MRVVSKRRLATTTIGIILAIAIIFSMFTLGNNFSKYKLYETLQNEKYEITLIADIHVEDYAKFIKSLGDVPHSKIVFAEIDVLAPIFINNTESVEMRIGDMHDEKGIHLIDGRFPRGDDELIVNSMFAENDNISVNSVLKSVNNVTLKVVGIYDNSNSENRAFGYASLPTLKKLSDVGNAEVYFKVNADYLINSNDFNEIQKKLWVVENNIYAIASKYSDDPRTQSVFSYYPDFIYTISSLLIALPIIVMGAYLSKVAIEIELTERRREFGILKIRGATEFQRSKMILWESTIYGLAGGIIGYLLGEGMALLSNFLYLKLPFFTLDLNLWAFLSAIISSFILFFFAIYKPWKKIKHMPIISLISHYSQEFKKIEYSPGKDFTLSVIMWGYIAFVIYLSRTVSFNGGFNIMIILVIIAMSIFGMLYPFILILLPLTMARLMTLGTHRIYEGIVRGVARLSGVFGELARKGVERNPKNVAYIAFILAFILTYSSFISVMNDNEEMMNDIIATMSVGGDFHVDIDNSYTSPASLVEIANSKNQSAHCWIREDSGSLFNEMTEIYYADFNNYTRSVYHLDLFLKDGRFKKGSAVITSQTAKKYSLKVGDVISIAVFENHSKVVNYVIGGITYSFPGIGSDGIMLDGKANYSSASMLIIKAKNYDAMRKELMHEGVQFTERRNDDMNYYKYSVTTAQVFLLLLGSATIFIIQYSLYFNRRGEISLYRVRGATRGQVRKILMIEGLAVVIISTIIGLSVGITLAYVWISSMMIMTNLPSFFFLGYNFGITTLAMLVGFGFMQYAISFLFSRVKIAEILRAQGGEM